jgi:hypothetical protein
MACSTHGTGNVISILHFSLKFCTHEWDHFGSQTIYGRVTLKWMCDGHIPCHSIPIPWIQLNTDVENICLPSSGMVDRYKYFGGAWCCYHLCTWGIHVGIDGNWYWELEQCLNWELVSEDGGSSFIQNVGTYQITWCHLLIVTSVRASHLTKQIHLGLITISTVSRMRNFFIILNITFCFLLLWMLKYHSLCLTTGEFGETP